MSGKIRKLKDWFIKYFDVMLLIISGITLISFGTKIILFSYYHVDTTEYANVDFEWIDDFGNYEVVIPYEDKNLYLTVRQSKVTFIYTNEDFLNFVAVNHDKRICDKKDSFTIKAFYINLNYKEIDEDEI